MEKLLTFLCLLGAVPLYTHAQLRFLPSGNVPFEQMTQSILNGQLPRAAQRPTAGDPVCLVGYALYVAGALRDSFRYVYSGGRGTGPQPADITYDHGFFWPQAPVRPSELGNTAHDYMPYDSMYCYYADSSGALSEYMRYMKSYNSSNLMTKLITQDFTAAFNSYKYEVSYDEADRLMQVLSSLDFSDDLTGDYHPHLNMYFGYDVAGTRVLDSVAGPAFEDAHYNNYYYYNTDGLPDSMIQMHASGAGDPYFNHMRYNYSYDSLQRLVKAQRQLWLSGTGWLTMTEQHLSYSGTAKLPTYRLILDAGNLEEPLLSYSLYEATLLPGGLLYDTVFVKLDLSGTGVLENFAFYKNHYTADDVLIAQHAYFWSSEGTTLMSGSAEGYSNSPNETRHYTYTGIAPTAVAEIQQRSAIRVYPNPATNYLTIEGAITARVYVFNLSGQLVLQQSGTAQNGKLQIDISNLPAGSYLADLLTESGSSKVKFIKQ